MRALSVFWAAAILFAVPVSAAENIECGIEGYSAEDQKVLGSYMSTFTLEGMENPAVQNPMIAIVSSRVNACAEELKWSEAAADAAFSYATISLDEKGLRLASPKASSIVDRIDSDLPTAERDRMWAIMNIATDPDSTDDTMNDDDMIFLGGVLMKLNPEGDDKTDAFVGSLMAMVLIRRNAVTEFAGL